MTDRLSTLNPLTPASDMLDELPEVVLEFRQGGGRSATFNLAHVDFLIGTVPGCDLRVSGTELPAVLCLLARRPGGLSLRKLAPTQVVLVNGRTTTQAELVDGDRITVGASDIFVRLTRKKGEREKGRKGEAEEVVTAAVSPSPFPPFSPSSLQAEREAFEEEKARRQAEIEEAERQLQQLELKLQEQTEQLDKERTAWLQRRQQLQQTPDPASLPPDLRKREEQLSLHEAELQDQLGDVKRQKQELANVRQELADIRKQLYDRYQERRDRLAALQESVDRAARKVQERKRVIDAEAEAQEERGNQLEQHSQKLDHDRLALEQDRRAFQEARDKGTRELAEKAADLQTREHRLAADRLELEGMVKHYQADVLRLDRLQDDLREREGLLKTGNQELDQQHARLRQDSAELEQQAEELEEWRTRLVRDAEDLEQNRAEQTARTAALDQQGTELQAQQASLASLKTRLDRQREELQSLSEHLDEQRTRQERAEADIEKQMQESLRFRAELDADRKLRDQERQDILQRQSALDTGEQELQQDREMQTRTEAELQFKKQELELRFGDLKLQERTLREKLAQLTEAQAHVAADQQSLQARTEQLNQAEQACQSLQEQQRLRGDELAGLHKNIEERTQRHEADSAAFKGRQAEWEKYHKDAHEQLAARKTQHEEKAMSLAEQARQLEQEREQLFEREESQRRQLEQLRAAEQAHADQRHVLAQEREKFQADKQANREEQEQTQTLFIEMRLQAQSVVEQLADIDLQSGSTLDRLAHAREQLRDHLAEINGYVRQCQQDSEKDALRLEESEKSLRQQQDELRLALVSFRQEIRQLEQRRDQLLELEESQRKQMDQLHEAGKGVADQRQKLSQEREKHQLEQQATRQEQEEARALFIEMRLQAQSFVEQLPDVELRTGTTIERLGQAREQLRDHLAEINGYIRHCQEETQKDARRIQDMEKSLRQNQDEHRLAIVSFRQQLVDWQGQVSETKRLTAPRKPELESDKARRGEGEKGRVAERAKGTAVQEWYRLKFRNLAGSDVSNHTASAVVAADESGSGETDDGDAPLIPIRRDILSLTDPADPSDRQLGELLRRYELVDGDTLQALLVDSRRQRRPLRQVLLSGGAVTPYQLALVEAGNVDGLTLGPLQVIDRVRATPLETAYHVFDPRLGQEALARHLSEGQAKVPARIVEFKKSFTRAMIAHPNLEQTLEVMDVAQRPAVLQEWLAGVPSSDWPALVAVPGVCFRLLIQAGQAMDAMHSAGLVHGHLHDGSILLTADGVVKVRGLGEPSWLVEGEAFDKTPTAGSDLRALGTIASKWCTPIGVRRGAKTKPPPDALVTLVMRLATDGKAGYASAPELLGDLERIRKDVPENPEAWERLLRHVREHAGPVMPIRRSA